MGNTSTINIYYSSLSNQYLVEVVEGGNQRLNDFMNFTDDDRKLLLSAFPTLDEEQVYNAVLGSEFVDLVLKPAIESYNKNLSQSKNNCWYVVSGDNIINSPTFVDKQNLTLISQTEGKVNRNQILKIVAQHQEQQSKKYAVFQCTNCGKLQMRTIVNNVVKCKCGSAFSVDEIAKAKYTSNDSKLNLLNAITKFNAMRNDTGNNADKVDNRRKVLRYFYYGDDCYAFSLSDFLLLHRTLYANCAYKSVFVETADGLKFCDSYRQYIEALQIKGVCKTLYDNLNTIESQLNSLEYGTNNIAVAFYWYIKNYCLTDITTLRCKFDGKVFVFDNINNYANTLVGATDTKLQTQLKELFCSLTTQESCFFAGYNNYDSTELSRLIYDNSGLFVYINGEQLVNFGEQFVTNLHLDENNVTVKEQFLQSIVNNVQFWTNVKQKYNCIDNYDIEGCLYMPEFTAYDRLCFCQFVLSGKQKLNYKAIELYDSIKGFNFIKQTIYRAYLSGSQEDLTVYAQLVELLNKQHLCMHLLNLQACKQTITDKKGKVLREYSFADICQDLKGEHPDMQHYLMCIDKVNASQVFVRYNGKADTFVNQLFRLLNETTTKQSSNYRDRVIKFTKDKNVNCFEQYLFSTAVKGGADKFEKDCKDNFDKLVYCLQQLQKQSS